MASPDDEIWIDRLYLKCDCTLEDHLLEFEVVDLDAGMDMDKKHWTSIQLQASPILNPEGSFWKRLWIAFRYIVKKEPRYSRHFDAVCVTAGEDLDKLQKMIQKVFTISNERKKNWKGGRAV